MCVKNRPHRKPQDQRSHPTPWRWYPQKRPSEARPAARGRISTAPSNSPEKSPLQDPSKVSPSATGDTSCRAASDLTPKHGGGGLPVFLRVPHRSRHQGAPLLAAVLYSPSRLRRACDGSAAAWPLSLTGNPPGSTETTMGTILYTTDPNATTGEVARLLEARCDRPRPERPVAADARIPQLVDCNN